MADLTSLFSGILSGALTALDQSERDHLMAHVAAVQKLGGNVTLDGILQSMQAGWLPDYFAAAELTVSAQLAMSSSRQQTIQGTAGATLGPVQVTGSLAQTTARAENTNLTVTATLERQSRSKAVGNAFDALLVNPGTPPLTPPVPPAPVLPHNP